MFKRQTYTDTAAMPLASGCVQSGGMHWLCFITGRLASCLVSG
jgi:hypothetical protein